MKKLKTFLLIFPEYYLIVLVLLAGYTPPLSVKPFSLVIIFLLMLQILFKNGISGVILATLFLMVNLYMFLAMISEFSEFPSVNGEALRLLGAGLFLFAVNFSASALMILKYTRSDVRNHF